MKNNSKLKNFRKGKDKDLKVLIKNLKEKKVDSNLKIQVED